MTNMKSNLKTFLLYIDECIEICCKKLAEPDADDECTSRQITEVVIPDMIDLSRRAITGNVPKSCERFSSAFAHAFKLWGWNMNEPSELYLLLLKIDRLYKAL